MNETTNLRRLSGFEWFGLLSGIIGLVADTYTLASVFARTQNILPSSPQPTVILPVHMWLAIFCSIIYTLFILSFYARRVFCIRYRREKGNLSSYSVERIESGALVSTCTRG